MFIVTKHKKSCIKDAKIKHIPTACVSFFAGGDVGGGGVHVLLLPAGLIELPPAAGPAGFVRPGGRAPDTGCCQKAEAGCVWKHGGRLHELRPAGILRGRHSTCLSGGE